ncbi:MAG: phosphatase PAP2 family protein [Polyangia bacterium]
MATLTTLAPITAAAQAQVAPVPVPSAVAPAVEWSDAWPRFRLWEYGGTAGFGAATWALDRYLSPPSQPKWRGGVLFDDSVRSWLRVDTRGGRERAGRVSDITWLGGSAVPFVVDLPIVLLAHRQPGVAFQLLMMDLEAYAFAGFINRSLHFGLGRGRPSLDACAADSGYDELCGGRSNNASFPSGHTLGVATAAGLTCVHHRYLPIYGGPIADGGACGLMALATVVTGATRIMADRHHATDVIAGAMIGFASGYGLPWLLHYRASGQGEGGASPGEGHQAALVPFAGPTEVGVGLVGTL